MVCQQSIPPSIVLIIVAVQFKSHNSIHYTHSYRGRDYANFSEQFKVLI